MKKITITHVAIKYNGMIYSKRAPARHHDVIRAMGGIYGPDTQGFLDSKGRFLDRREAYKLAEANGQLKREPGGYGGELLYSEDLW